MRVSQSSECVLRLTNEPATSSGGARPGRARAPAPVSSAQARLCRAAHSGPPVLGAPAACARARPLPPHACTCYSAGAAGLAAR